MDLLAKENWPRLLLNPKKTESRWKKALKAEGVSGKNILNAKSEISGLAVKNFCRAKFLLRRLRKYRKRRRVIIVLFLWALKTVFWRSALLTRTTLKRKGPCNLLFPE